MIYKKQTIPETVTFYDSFEPIRSLFTIAKTSYLRLLCLSEINCTWLIETHSLQKTIMTLVIFSSSPIAILLSFFIILKPKLFRQQFYKFRFGFFQTFLTVLVIIGKSEVFSIYETNLSWFPLFKVWNCQINNTFFWHINVIIKRGLWGIQKREKIC